MQIKELKLPALHKNDVSIYGEQHTLIIRPYRTYYVHRCGLLLPTE